MIYADTNILVSLLAGDNGTAFAAAWWAVQPVPKRLRKRFNGHSAMRVKDSCGSPPRMMLRMNLFQPLSRYVRVNLRRRNIGVPEQQLHNAQIRAVIDQVRGECVSQRVWRDRFVHARLDRVALDHVPEHLARHSAAALRDKHIVTFLATENFRACRIQIALDDIRSRLT